MFYSSNDYRNYLIHHGIKGQKWGVKNGPPYPLSGNDSNSMPQMSTKSELRKYKRDLVKATREKDAKDKRDHKKGVSDANALYGALSFMAGLALTSVGLISPGLIMDGTSEFIAAWRTENVFYDIKKSKAVDEHGIPLKRKTLTPQQDLKRVNPSYGTTHNQGANNNCMACTATYDLRRRGYDVTSGLFNEGFGVTRIEKWYPGAKLINWDMPGFDPYSNAKTKKDLKLERAESAKKLIDGLIRQGNGARGHFAVYWKKSGAHDMIYEVDNGKLILRDGQSNSSYLSERAIRDLLERTWNIQTYRTDNVEPDLAKMIEDGVIRWDPKQK